MRSVCKYCGIMTLEEPFDVDIQVTGVCSECCRLDAIASSSNSRVVAVGGKFRWVRMKMNREKEE